VVTPRIAGQSDRVDESQRKRLKANIAHLVKGQPPVNVVDQEKGLLIS
jgi:hypothetical protein